MAYEFCRGFGRAWQHNKDLVGGEYPAEQNDWGFGDDSSFTQLRTKNGLLQWVELVRGGQKITFTDLRENPPRRYVLLDPPDNRLVEVPSPGPQDPDTGQPLDGDEQPAPLPGPEPTPPKPEPDERATVLYLADFSGGKTLGRESQADLDAWSRLEERGRSQGGKLAATFNERGRYLMREPRGRDLDIGIRSLFPAETWLVADPRSPGTFLEGFRSIDNISIDGSGDRMPEDRLEGCNLILFTRHGQKARNVTITNFPFLGFAVADGAVDCEIHNPTIIGNNPGGWFKEGKGWLCFFGIWSGNGAHGLKVYGGTVTGCGLNGAFLSGRSELVEGTTFYGNHRAYNFDNGQKYGGGQVCAAGVDGTYRRVTIKDPAEHGSGLELDGDDQTVEYCDISGHAGRNGVTLQNGKHVVRWNNVTRNGVGLHWTRGDKGSYVPDVDQQFRGNDRNVVRD